VTKRRYYRQSLYNVWVDEYIDIPDDYVIPTEDDGYPDMDEFMDDMWDNQDMRASEEKHYKELSDSFRALPGYIEHEMMDGGFADRGFVDENDVDIPKERLNV
jgi:hypothetical protein